MPQLDIAIFFNQFFWFFGSFICLYYFLSHVVIPKVNLYYFIRYNIILIIREFDNLVVLPDLDTHVSSQNSAEFDVVYMNICSHLYSNFKLLTQLINTESRFDFLGEVNVFVLDFFPSEILADEVKLGNYKIY